MAARRTESSRTGAAHHASPPSATRRTRCGQHGVRTFGGSIAVVGRIYAEQLVDAEGAALRAEGRLLSPLRRARGTSRGNVARLTEGAFGSGTSAYTSVNVPVCFTSSV